MQLKEFLDICSKQPAAYITSNPVLFFCVEEKDDIPIVFMQQFFAYLRGAAISVETIDLEERQLPHVIGRLETSFLGMNLVLWLRGLDRVDKAYRQTILDYVTKYQGPHCLALCIDKEHVLTTVKKSAIMVPTSINPELFVSLFIFFNKKISKLTTDFIGQLCRSYGTISLDQACMILTYMQVMGKQENTADLFDKILNAQKSLFGLAQNFFAKESASFFKLWSRFENEYPLTFWTAYWGEQLWRAYYVHYYLTNQQFAQAKSIGFRLPFSYAQKDWKKSTLSELKNAHQFVYELDLNVKNSVESQAGIELLYSKFFLNQFC